LIFGHGPFWDARRSRATFAFQMLPNPLSVLPPPVRPKVTRLKSFLRKSVTVAV
jgi:hypothetical protein